MDRIVLRHATDQTKFRILERRALSEIEPLLVQYLNEGQLVAELPDLEAMRARRIADVERLDAGVRRLMYPHIYHVSLTQQLWDLKQDLIRSALHVDDLQHMPANPEADPRV